jgi:hypothetical protein
VTCVTGPDDFLPGSIVVARSRTETAKRLSPNLLALASRRGSHRKSNGPPPEMGVPTAISGVGGRVFPLRPT